MARELVAIAPRTPVLRDYDPRSPSGGEVLIRTQFSSVKHGTELSMYQGEADWVRRRMDPELGLLLEEQPGPLFPRPLGNMAVGVVEEIGQDVVEFKPGDRVFGYMPARDTHTLPAGRIQPLPAGMTPQTVVCLDPVEFAVGAVRDGHVRVGDRVGVFGLGAIGLMAVQIARLQGAQVVLGVDPVRSRRGLALELGADAVFDPTAGDVGLEIKRACAGQGLDVAIDYSSVTAALHDAIRALGYEGVLVAGAVYKPATPDLVLGNEFHWNRIRIVSSRAVSQPDPDHPRWNHARIVETSMDLLKAGRIVADPVVAPVVAFDVAAKAYAEMETDPEHYIKLSFRHV